MLAAASAGLYPHGHAVSSQSIVRHDEGAHYAPLGDHYGHFAAPAHYAAPLVHAAPLAQYYAPIEHYEGHDEYVSIYC